MSGMTFGSMVEADRRLRAHEVNVRRNRQLARDREVWRRYEQEFSDELDRAADARIENSK